MLGLLLEKLTEFSYFVIDAFGNIKAKSQMSRTMLYRVATA